MSVLEEIMNVVQITPQELEQQDSVSERIVGRMSQCRLQNVDVTALQLRDESFEFTPQWRVSGRIFERVDVGTVPRTCDSVELLRLTPRDRRTEPEIMCHERMLQPQKTKWQRAWRRRCADPYGGREKNSSAVRRRVPLAKDGVRAPRLWRVLRHVLCFSCSLWSCVCDTA